MTDIERAARMKLSVTRCSDKGRVHQGSRTTEYAHRGEIKRDAGMRSGIASSAFLSTPSGLSSILDPVCSHFGLEDESAADLAAFTRRILGCA